MTDTTASMLASGTASEVELFRFAAVRPPKLALGSLPVIPLEITLARVDPPLFDPVTGVLADVTVTFANQQIAFPLGKLDRELAKRNDRWAPPEIEKWVKDSTGRNTRDFVAASGWSVHRGRVHWFLAEAFRSEDEIEGDIASDHLVRPTVMLRACRLIGLVESLAGQRDRLADADTVQRFVRYATVQLSPDLLLPNPNPLARPPAIADLKVVRLGPPRYEPGAIAHIENVMATEKRERTHRVLEQMEETTTRETERIEESERDLTTTSQVQMQQEAMEALRSSTDLEAGLQVSASYGPTVSVEVDTRLARHDSTETVNRAAASLSNSITQQARQRVVERIQETRTVRRLFETEETNLHGFDNQENGSTPMVGVYRYVQQVQDAWMENYGKRLMLEFLVPEPAAVLQWAFESVPAEEDDPEPPRPKNPANAAQNLLPQQIDEVNYLQLVGQHDANGVTPPPPPSVELAVSFKPQADDDLYLFEDSKALKVPTGYHATTWSAQCVTWGAGGPDHSWMVGVGENADPVENNDGNNLRKHLSGSLDAQQDSVIPVVMLGRGLLSLSASVRVHCERTFEHLEKWKLAVFDQIMNAWESAHQEWEARASARAFAESTSSPLQGGASPDENRAVERRELRRSVIHMLLGAPEDAGPFAGKAVERPDSQRPTLDLNVAASERDSISFFEQAFEWTNMTWIHYPYYWADADQWAESIRRSANDPLWAAFLSAGASRVVVPVRPGFESAIGLYLSTGVIWAGGQVPTVGDPAYLGIAEEIAESLGTGGVEPERTPLEPVRLPTQLVWLQPTSALNPVPAPTS
jgi:hypothetical protein